MLVIAIVGIRITARTQVGIAVVEYLILIGMSIAGLVAVINHHPGTFPITKGWFSLSGIGGRGDAVAGLLIAVFVYSGWEGTLYVNEEVKHRAPTRAGQPSWPSSCSPSSTRGTGGPAGSGVTGQAPGPIRPPRSSTSPRRSAAVWAKMMAFALALSVIATTVTGIVLSARIVYGMASYRTLPGFLSNVSRRFHTPVAASIIVGLLLIVLTAVYLLATSVQDAFSAVIDVSGLLFASFYILTALATVVYYRRRVFSSVWDVTVPGHPAPRGRRIPRLDHRRSRCRAHPRRRSGRWWAVAVLGVSPDASPRASSCGRRSSTSSGRATASGSAGPGSIRASHPRAERASRRRGTGRGGAVSPPRCWPGSPARSA